MVNEYCVVKIKTQEEWDSLLGYLKNTGNWHRKDYERVFRSNYETEDIGIEIINDIIDGYSNYNWFVNNSDYNFHNFMTVQSFIKQKVHEVW